MGQVPHTGLGNTHEDAPVSKLSGIGVLQPRLINKEGKVSKRDLQAIDSMARLDEFSLKEYKGGEFADFPTKFGRILPRTIDKQESQYRERVYQFSHPEGVLSGSTHFPEADYLMHTRVYDDLIGNQDTRVVAEIQSDLHQHKKNIMLRPIAAEAAQKVADSVAWLNKPKEARLADYAEEFARNGKWHDGHHLCPECKQFQPVSMKMQRCMFALPITKQLLRLAWFQHVS